MKPECKSKYENLVIRPLLNLIEEHQEFLTLPENLPQLAKLGYMFERFYLAGRIAYGSRGKIKNDDYACENNPKYEIGDHIDYLNEDIENLIYDAWGLHVKDYEEVKYPTIKDVRDLILGGTKELSDFEKKLRKQNKTFDEWVDIKTDPQYRYSSLYGDRKSVADHLLCVIGNGYGYNKELGIVFEEASGADQDRDLYGHWENAILDPMLLPTVTQILEVKELDLALKEEVIAKEEWKKERNKEFDLSIKELEELGKTLSEKIESLALPEDLEIEDEKEVIQQPYKYYPLCEYSIITMFDEIYTGRYRNLSRDCR